MSKLIDLSKPESRNWLKQWRAVYLTRQALLPTVSEEANQLHGDIIQKAPVPACTTCSFKDVQKKNASCKFHPFFRNELVIKHAYGKAKGIDALALKNTKPENWINSPWEIAKVFMPPSGYENKNTIEDTDFNGIAGFMINCKRFQGKITDTVCIKAREVVNHIRHMPDISSSDLTDLATTECIDNLYALLNEPALNTRPEVVLACKQLDELKTADPSNDENTYMYICKEIHSGFEQRLADIEMQLQTKETDTKSAKETLHTCSKQICETLKHLSGDAMHNLSKTKDDILRSIEEESRRVKNHITFLERKATEQIEQSITDGKTTLATHTAEEKRRAKEYIEQCVTEGKRTLKDETERLAKQLPKAEVESLQDKKRKLKTQLIQHYKITSSKMNLRLFIDETIEHIYEKPKLILKKIKNGTPADEPIPEVSKLFSTSDDPMAKIIVEGDAGTGKTSLCKKIVDEWRKEKENVEKASNLSKFEFVFFIILREVKTESKIKNMIVTHILEKIDSDYENDHSILGEILKREHCLLLLDGLDEWRGQMPHVETSWRNCTTLITTRPYKLAELKVSPTQVGKHVKLDGVQEPDNLVFKVIQKLEDIRKTNKDPKSCEHELKRKQLWHFRENPVLLVHIVWLWHKNELTEVISRTTLYQKIFDERWNGLCNKKDTDIDRQEFFDFLSEIAFDKLFSENEDESLVFNIEESQLKKFQQFIDASLVSGIMLSSIVGEEQDPQYQFLHKTFQEYLSAVFLSKRGSKLPFSCQRIKNIHSNHRNENVLALKQVFFFLCGLNPAAAAEFSKTLNELFTTENCEETGSAYEVGRFQSMIFEGYDEAERNKQVKADFCLQHVSLMDSNLTDDIRSKLKMCLHDRNSSLVSLRICGKNYLWCSLQCKDDPTVLDLLSFKNLKIVELDDVPFEDINLLNLNGLVRCRIQFKDYKQASKLVASVQSSDLGGLKHLVLKNVGLECEAVDILSKLKCVKTLDLTWSKASRLNDSHFDFEHLRHLEDLISLTFRELPLFDVVVNSQLFKLEELHIGFRTQQRAPKLMETLLQEFKGSPTAVPKGPPFIETNLTLVKVHMSAEVYRRLVNMVLQWKDPVNFNLDMCTIEEDITQVQEEMGNDPSLQMVAPQAALTDFETIICLWNMSVPVEVFRRLVIMVLQSRHFVILSLNTCIIEDDITQGQEEMGKQPALQVVAPQAASVGLRKIIDLEFTPMSTDVFLRLVSVVIQSRHCFTLKLMNCTIKENIKQEQEETRNKRAKTILCYIFETDLTTYIRFNYVTVSTEVFRRLVSEVLQSVNSLDVLLHKCTLEVDITQEQEEIENQSALKVMAPQAASTDYTTKITLHSMTVSAEVFRHLLRVVKQSGHIVICEINNCIIKPKKEVSQLQAEMKEKPAVQVIEFNWGINGWRIKYKNNV